MWTKFHWSKLSQITPITVGYLSAVCLSKSVVLSCLTENKVAVNKQTNHFSILFSTNSTNPCCLGWRVALRWAQGIKGLSFGQEMDETLQYRGSTVVECHRKGYDKTGGRSLTCRTSFRRFLKSSWRVASCLVFGLAYWEPPTPSCKMKVGSLNWQPQAVSFKGNPQSCTNIGMELRIRW